MEELREFIMNELPLNGEWWSDGFDEFIDSANKMYSAGMSKDDIKEILQDLYNSVKNEFGA